MRARKLPPPDIRLKRVLYIQEFCDNYGPGRAKTYKLIKSGECRRCVSSISIPWPMCWLIAAGM
jgi:hypothetical protein